jgi:transposase
MIQQLMYDRFGVFYTVFYIAQLLKTLGLSCQKAALVSAHLDEAKRQAWRPATWPHMLRRAKARKALLLFGDEASFPQWGTLTYTWARRGQQPKVKTCGKRTGYKVFGLIDSFTGHFFYPGQEGRLNSAAYIAFLTRVLAQPTQPIILMQDGATYHTSAETKAFFAQQTARLEVVQLPAYSPDYTPIEKLWKKIKQQETHLHYFPTFEALTEKVEQALRKFTQAPEAILALCSLPTELAQAASVH